jgi:hypothetical protein
MTSVSPAADPVPRRVNMARRVVAPPLLAFALIAAYMLAESSGHQLLAQPEAQTISEAAARGEAARALELIRAGQNVNGRLRIREGIIGSSPLMLTPVEAAIVGRHVELVRLLFRTGARPPGTAVCLAQERLPELLPELGGAPAESASTSSDVTTALARCVPSRAADE